MNWAHPEEKRDWNIQNSNVYESLLAGIRSIGRPRAGWKDQVYKDIRKNFGLEEEGKYMIVRLSYI